ncbi:uncharacterized protein KIAA1958-like [Lytechinus variegatus]|uniref:uncharacterized protein KIAA1958-like n=1 Tax=Lytechinus variegatus TaxID=7654 RepID=UPI001BB1C364|nr:uncharacterized protein KIAA1958-like [Lytechinus variegatus]
MAAVMDATRRRFADLDSDNYEQLLNNKDSENTHKATKISVSVFKDYLREKNLNTEFEQLDKLDLANILRKFYLEVRKVDGDFYKRASLLAIRQGLNRHLKKPEGQEVRVIDITKDVEFSEANIAFKAALVQLKTLGKGDTTHKCPISQEDINQLYKSGVFDENTPQGLQYKVFFELMLFICRRGRENLRELTPDHFEIGQDNNGRRYVYQSRDELTKKTRENNPDSRVDAGRMYSTGELGCPVNSYEKYVSKLNPKCSALFQTPVTSEAPKLWYKNIPVGQKTLGQMMSTINISKRAELSRIYTNHCIRATAITILDRKGFSAHDICSISGHHNEASLGSYTGLVTGKRKRELSDALISSITHSRDKAGVSRDECVDPEVDLHVDQSSHQQPQKTRTSECEYDEQGQEDSPILSDSQVALIDDIIGPQPEQIHNINMASASRNTTTSMQMHPLVFNNCTNITINYNNFQ